MQPLFFGSKNHCSDAAGTGSASVRRNAAGSRWPGRAVHPSGGTLPMFPDPEGQDTLLTMPSHISTVMSTSVRMERSWVTTRTSRSFEYSFRIFITLNAFS